MSTPFRPRLRLAGAATLVAGLLATALGALLLLDDGAGTPTARLVRSSDVRPATASPPAVDLAPAAPVTPSAIESEVVREEPPTAATQPAPEMHAQDSSLGDTTVDAMEAGADEDDRARAARLLADLAAETDLLAATVIGEELAPLASELDPAGRRALVALARDADAPRSAALTALGRLEPTAETIDLVRQLVLARPSREARAAGVDALALLAERGAPGELVEAAMLELTDPAF